MTDQAHQPDLLSAADFCATCGVDPCACVQLHLAEETPLPSGERDRPRSGQGEGTDAADLAALHALWSSPSIPAFLNRRAEQWLKHGHSPAADLGAPLDRLPRAAMTRLHDAVEKATPDGGNLDYMLRKAEIAGACLMAWYDQLLAAKAGRGGDA